MSDFGWGFAIGFVSLLVPAFFSLPYKLFRKIVNKG